MGKKEDYRERRAQACQELFSDFEPDLTKSKEPFVVKVAWLLAKHGFYTKEIAQRLGKTPKAIQKIYRRYNFPKLHNFCTPQMEERPDWKHGEKMMKGYLYRRTPSHPNKLKHGGYVAVHRLVMEKKLGRYLLKTEVVDHRDGNIENNHPDNLRVFASNGEHLAETLKGKCPQWSEEGKASILAAVSGKRIPRPSL
jgi:hypothetical protein